MQPSDPVARIIWLEGQLKDLARQVKGLKDQAAQEAQQLALAGSGGGPSGGTTTAVARTGAGGIPAVSGSSLGSNSVTLYDPTAFPTLTLSGTAVTAYNTTATSVGGSKVVQLKQIGGLWFVDVESC